MIDLCQSFSDGWASYNGFKVFTSEWGKEYDEVAKLQVSQCAILYHSPYLNFARFIFILIVIQEFPLGIDNGLATECTATGTTRAISTGELLFK